MMHARIAAGVFDEGDEEFPQRSVSQRSDCKHTHNLQIEAALAEQPALEGSALMAEIDEQKIAEKIADELGAGAGPSRAAGHVGTCTAGQAPCKD